MDIKVSYQDLRSTSTALKTEKTKLKDSVTEINRIMNDIKSKNESEALNALAERFEKFKSGAMENCANLVDKFAKFLEDSAKLYEEHDDTMRKNVESGVGNKDAFKA